MEPHHIDHLTPIALITMAALLCGLLFIRARQPAIVGYIIAGVVLGPTGFELVTNTQSVQILAELGVIMLLFLIGMELSLRGFKAVYKIAVGTAILQIILFVSAFSVIGYNLDWELSQILLFGFALSLSSTAVAIKILEETDDLRTEVGRITVGVLIAQDLAVIPMLLIINSFGENTVPGMEYLIVIKLLSSVGFLAWLAWFLSRREGIKLPLVTLLERRPDIAPLAALASCFTLATLSGVLGLSTAYGAFIAGLVIGNSNARNIMHQATHSIQTVLMMVFFLSIGLLIDLDYITTHWSQVLSLLALVTIFKTIFNVFILRLLKEPWERAVQTGVVIGQVGEFSFVLVAAGLTHNIISADSYRLMIAVIALSLIISPMWLSTARRLHKLTEQGYTSLKDILTGFISSENFENSPNDPLAELSAEIKKLNTPHSKKKKP